MSVGMYSTKYFNKNKMDGNAYMCIGDPYKPPVANAFRQPEKGAPKPKFRIGRPTFGHKTTQKLCGGL